MARLQNTVELSFHKKINYKPTIERLRKFATSPSVKTLKINNKKRAQFKNNTYLCGINNKK